MSTTMTARQERLDALATRIHSHEATLAEVDEHEALEELSEAEAFFYERAAYSYAPATESEGMGRIRSARRYAAAEAYAKAQGWYTETESEGVLYTWEDECFDIVPREKLADYADVDLYEGYTVTLYDSEDNHLESLGGVTFGKEYGEREQYERVVAAELASEAAL